MYSPATGVSSLLHNSELKLADSHGRNIYFLCVELATDEEAILAVAIRCAYSLLYVEPSYEAKKIPSLTDFEHRWIESSSFANLLWKRETSSVRKHENAIKNSENTRKRSPVDYKSPRLGDLRL